MKKIIDNFKYLGVVLALLFLVSCEDELLEEYQSIDVIGAPSLEISISNVADSTFHLNYTLGADGWVSVAVFAGQEIDEPTTNQMKLQNAPDAVFTTHFEATGEDRSGTVLVTGVVQNTNYVVYAMPTSVDGASGNLVEASVQTSDVYPPELLSTTPAVSSSADKAKDFQVVLNFDEPVLVDNAEGVVFRYLNIVTMEFTNVTAESVVAEGNSVRVTQPQTPIAGQYVFLNVSDDAIKDRAGNFYEGFSSGLTAEGGLAGKYWRIAYSPLAYSDVSPELGEAVQDLNFKIVLTYDLPMDFRRGTGNAVVYTASDVIVRYRQSGTTINVEVPSSHIAFDGNVVTITPPRTPVFGETVSLIVKENAFRTRYNSPVAAIPEGELSWLISYGYTRDMIIHNYNVKSVSTFGENPEYNFDVTITADETDPSKVIIVGLENSDAEITGYFNGDFATLTIPQDQSLGDLLGDGSDVLLWSNRSASGDLIGYIQPDGSIIMDWASYIVGGDYDGYYYDRYYDSLWTIKEAQEKNSPFSTSNPKKKPIEVKSINRHIQR